MAFKPKTPSAPSGGSGNFENTSNYPVPKSGLRKARVSLIVDLGTQPQEDFVDQKTKEVKPRDPVQQLAVFVDLVNDVVDYGGKIGMQQYRLPINNTFKGDFKGIVFKAVPQKDAEGNILKDKDGKWLPFVLHPASPLTKLAKAGEREDIIKSMDIEQLLDLPLMVDVEVKVTPHKEGKLDNEGKPIVYKNVNFKGAAKVPTEEDDEGNERPGKVKPLTQPALLLSFDNTTKEQVTFIRPKLRAMIKACPEYPGSKMQAAFEAFEAESGSSSDDGDEPAKAPAPAPEKKKRTPAPPPKPETGTGFDDMDDDVPF